MLTKEPVSQRVLGATNRGHPQALQKFRQIRESRLRLKPRQAFLPCCTTAQRRGSNRGIPLNSLDETLAELRRKQREGAIYDVILSIGFGRRKTETVVKGGLNYKDARSEEQRLMQERTDKGFAGPCYFIQRRKGT
ncbi:hypothetical protein [Noviherbaspirillum pedocola]|uniref:Uncharacterized protein n=1 Tax=Noviherbaspirillum pedocola TaxID=2801341 RepID=A0A934T1W0_9BURK|nr:hypothetical protein [Noviherbaspirillum pedocola]MBK4736148.1 hypothetical protein [Noviherbaspirillum pedocola]